MKKLAFTIALLKFVEWYLENTHATIKTFQEENNFTPLKLKLLPYFLCTANGNRKAMFSIFDSYCVKDEGYMEYDINKEIEVGNNLFEVFLIKENGLEITETGASFFTKSKCDIEKFTQHNDINNLFIPTSEILNQEDFLNHIDHSVCELKSQDFKDNGGILTLSASKLSDLSKIHTTYKMYKQGYVKYSNSSKEIVDTRFLIKEMSMYGNKDQRIEAPLFELLHI